ncbi:Putative predicted metal-dependent hydrolase [hydrothermal vent metagenome]|uniref:Predicted metal-dependent hydrolase n=1 Tax=hydrothermal vent metagenome TaxID=652676 RepID=A0A3B0VP18_9ZZZZ
MFDLKAKQITHHQIGERDLEVVRTARKDSIALKVRADRHNRVVILVPKRYSNRQLTKVLLANQSWLSRSLIKLEQQWLSQFEFSVFTGEWGESFDFLGQPVILVRADIGVQGELSLFKRGCSGAENLNLPFQVRILNHQCHIAKSLATRQQRCAAIEAFMIQTAQNYLPAQLTHYAQQIGVTCQRVQVKGYKSCWGSCSPDGRLQFNWRLMQAPNWVIDYVVVHELCHLIHPNHSRDFWALVQQHYPKTNEAKAYIKQYGVQWIHFLQS